MKTGRQHLSSSEKLLQEGRRESQLYTNLQQREQTVWTSKIKYWVKEFSSLSMRKYNGLTVYSFHMNLSYLGQTFFLVHLGNSSIPPAPQQSSWGQEVSASTESQFWEASFTCVETRNCWWLWHFLFINMAGYFHLTGILVLYYLWDILPV